VTIVLREVIVWKEVTIIMWREAIVVTQMEAATTMWREAKKIKNKINGAQVWALYKLIVQHIGFEATTFWVAIA